MKSAHLPFALLLIACSGTVAPTTGGGSTAVGGATASGGNAATGGNTNGATAVSVGGATASGGSAPGGSTTNGATTAVRACKDTITPTSTTSCHSVADCQGLNPIKCCTSGSTCWPASACPIPPSMCSQYSTSRAECSIDADCGEGGTCIRSVSGCPQCPSSSCQRPLPKCTQSPDSCGDAARCQADGSCAPLLCDAGYSCPTGSRCSIASVRADGHGCELIPCTDGWSCDVNSRCTSPEDKSSHGCTALACSRDSECDCGYCVNGSCTSNLGTCTPAPV